MGPLNGETLTPKYMFYGLMYVCRMLSENTRLQRLYDVTPACVVQLSPFSQKIAAIDWRALPTKANAEAVKVPLEVLTAFLFQLRRDDSDATSRFTDVIQRCVFFELG
jgi:hypothetical protein